MRHSRWFVPVAGLVVACIVALPDVAVAQADPFSFPFNSGQNVGPIFEGWSRNPDGSYKMHFGYINRNFIEELHVPVGADNHFEPGPADRGQPSFFYPRIHRQVFSVTVPANWGDRQLLWTLTLRGTTERAVAWLDPVWEIDPVYHGNDPGPEEKINTPPTVSAQPPAATMTLPGTLTLKAVASDDGLPKPRAFRGAPVGQESPPTLKATPETPEAPVNVPHLREVSGPPRRRPSQGLTVGWMVWRGPANVKLEPSITELAKAGGPSQNAEATYTATFTEPGEYVLRALAEDGRLTATADVKVTVVKPSR